jgi:outer membrane protein, protease secretion system
MKKTLQCILLCSVLFHAHAGEAAAEKLDLLRAWKKASSYDARLRVARADHEMQQEEIAKARAALRPAVQVQSSLGRNMTSGNAFPDTRYYNTASNSITLKQQLFDPGSEASYYKAHAVALQSGEQFKNETLDLIVRTTEVYFNLLFAQEGVRLSQAKVAAAAERLKQQETALHNGLGTVTAVDEARADFDVARAEQTTARNALDLQRYELERLTGIAAAEPAALSVEDFTPKSPNPKDIESWISLALEESPDIGAARQAMEIAQQELKKNRAAKYPTLNLVAGKSYSLSETNYTIDRTYDTYSVVLQAEVPLYTGGYVSAAIRQASTGRIKAEEELTWYQRQVIADIRKYYNGTLNALSEIQAYEQALNSRRTSLASAEKALKNGLGSIVDVLDAQEQLLVSHLDLSRARYHYIINLLMLKDTAGTLTAFDLTEVNEWLVTEAKS